MLRTRDRAAPLALLLACAAPPAGDPIAATSDTGAPSTTAAGDTTGDTTAAPTTAGELLPADVHFALDLATGAPTGALIGWNIGRGTYYAPADDPLHPEWRTPSMQAAAAALADLRPAWQTPHMRFSGLQIDGALGNDGYHYFTWVDPQRGVADGDNMASFEYFALIDESAATPLITLNFGSGTAAEAARYVTHLAGTDPADPDVAARIHWGRQSPYPVQRFELGNEVYGFWNTGYAASGSSYANPDAPGGGDPPWHQKPTADPAHYAARALEYIAAVRAVLPTARFWVPLAQAAMDTWGGTDAALAALAPLLADDAVEAVVVHHYQVDDARTLGWDDPGGPALLLAGSEVFRPGYTALQARLAALPRPLPLAVTEYHVAGAFVDPTFDERADHAVIGLGVADILLFYAQQDVAFAAQHMALGFGATDDLLFERWYNPFRAAGDAVVAMPSHVVTRLIADHLLPRRAALVPVAQVALDLAAGDRSFSALAVHAVAFASDDGGAATFVALHRDLAARPVTLDVPPGWTVAAAAQWAPPALDHDALAAPVAVTELAWQQQGDRVELTLAAHSVAAVRLAAP